VAAARRLRTWCFAVGLPAAAVQAILMLGGTSSNPWLKVVEAAGYALGVAPLALAYASTFVILWQSEAWRARLGRLAPAGRMALTNYLTHTVVGLTVFYGIRFGLMGRIGPVWWLDHGRRDDRRAGGILPVVATRFSPA
jgi:uncharacterized protein